MDYKLAKAITDMNVPFFGENLKNKGDSQSCMFDPRKLLSSPEILRYIAKKIAQVAKKDCKGNVLIGLATSGIAWGALTSNYSGIPFLYVRKKLEKQMSSRYIEGIIPKKAKVILIDDLLFAGGSKTEAIEIIKEHKLTVTDVIVIIDRQLQRKKDGPTLQSKYRLKLHSLITMEEIIQYMITKKAISKKQLGALIRDYRQYERWDMPRFAR